MLCTYIALGSGHISFQALHIYRSMLCTYIASCSVHISLYAQHILLFTYISACSVHSCSVHVALYVLLCTEPYVFIGIPSLGLRAVCLHKHSASEGALHVKLAPYSVKLAPYSAKLAFQRVKLVVCCRSVHS